MSSLERTGWRDWRISERHRMYGFDAPMVDIDFVVAEFDGGLARALVDYKHERAALPDLGHPSYRTLARMADTLGIPFLVCRYADDFSWLELLPASAAAHAWWRRSGKMGWLRCSELEYVGLLYLLRRRQVPASVLETLRREPAAAWLARVQEQYT